MVVIFAMINLFGWSGSIKNLFYAVSAPVQKVFFNFGNNASDFFQAYYNVQNWESENQYLQQENLRLLAKIAEIEGAQQENEILRQALNIGIEEDFDLALAEITAKQGDFIIINKGDKDGVCENMPVITAEKIVCGRVKEAFKDFARVALVTSAESSFGVKLQDKEIFGLAKGLDNGRLYLDRVPKDKEIQEGDIVVTTSLGQVFPKSLIVGKIDKVSRSDADPFQQAELYPLFDIDSLQKLFVVIEY